MDGSSQPASSIRFGAFELDLQAGELRKGGVKIKLQDQPFRVLVLLLKRPGEVVTREELRQALWSDDTFVDFDHGLNTAINKIREALGDSASHPRFVETLPRRGYRFIYPVEGLGERATAGASGLAGPQDDASTVSAQPSAPGQSQIARWISIAALVMLASGAVLWYRLSRPEAVGPPAAVPFTSFPGAEWAPAFSPDSQDVAFVWNGEQQNNYDIYVKRLGTEKPLQLTSHPNWDFNPTWSPDGRLIAFARRSAGPTELILVPALGGPAQPLGEVMHVPERVLNRFIGRGLRLAWSPSGKFLAVVDRASPQEPQSIFSLSIESRVKRRLTSPPGWAVDGDLYPAFSPDGHHLAFARFAAADVGDIHLLPLIDDGRPNGEARPLTRDQADIQGLDWTADGQSIVFSSNRLGGQRLWRISVSGGEPEPLGVGGDNVAVPSVSRQGGHLAFARWTLDRNIWRAPGPLAAHRKAVGEQQLPDKLIASSRGDQSPDYSPDGKEIVFDSNRSGTEEIWICDRDSTNPSQLTFFGGPPVGSPRWSPDRKWIAFDSRKSGNGDVYVIAASGGLPRQLTTHASYDVAPSWSHDSRWVYFVSSRSGEQQIWKIPAEGGEAVPVTRNGGRRPFESADGRFVYYVKPDVDGVWKMPVAGGEEENVLEEGRVGAWDMLEEGICFLDRPARTIQFFGFATGHTEPVVILPEGVRIFFSSLAVSPDGQWVLYVQEDLAESDIMLVENFR